MAYLLAKFDKDTTQVGRIYLKRNSGVDVTFLSAMGKVAIE